MWFMDKGGESSPAPNEEAEKPVEVSKLSKSSGVFVIEGKVENGKVGMYLNGEEISIEFKNFKAEFPLNDNGHAIRNELVKQGFKDLTKYPDVPAPKKDPENPIKEWTFRVPGPDGMKGKWEQSFYDHTGAEAKIDVVDGVCVTDKKEIAGALGKAGCKLLGTK